ncbi:MAG TPA: hypothetical protein VK177_15145 [Flavobacteriales bacterium]|nr:hypothetical protein [Flavobacteriales bacterium]
MRKIYSTCIALFIMAIAVAQAPGKISFQAVILDTNNTLVSNQNIGLQISILRDSTNSVPVYVETQNPISNASGTISLAIGSGSVVNGNFSSIDWSKGQYFIKTEIDPAGGTDYSIAHTTRFLSIPYAFYSNSANQIISLDNEINRANNSEKKIQSNIDSLQKMQAELEYQLQTYIK